jgi:hypothetical protein
MGPDAGQPRRSVQAAFMPDRHSRSVEDKTTRKPDGAGWQKPVDKTDTREGEKG